MSSYENVLLVFSGTKAEREETEGMLLLWQKGTLNKDSEMTCQDDRSSLLIEINCASLEYPLFQS